MGPVSGDVARASEREKRTRDRKGKMRERVEGTQGGDVGTSGERRTKEREME